MNRGRVRTCHGWADPNVGKGTNFLGTEQERTCVGARSELDRFNINFSDKLHEMAVGGFTIF